MRACVWSSNRFFFSYITGVCTVLMRTITIFVCQKELFRLAQTNNTIKKTVLFSINTHAIYRNISIFFSACEIFYVNYRRRTEGIWNRNWEIEHLKIITYYSIFKKKSSYELNFSLSYCIWVCVCLCVCVEILRQT